MFNKDLKLNLDKKIIRKNNIPLLYKDDQWIKLFGEIEDKSLTEPKEEIIGLKKVESEYRAEWRDLEREKTKMMKLILTASDSVNNENQVENVPLLDEYKDTMLTIKDRMDELQFELELIPGKIRDANFRLLEATVAIGYSEIKIKRQVLEESSRELEELRIRLRELVEIKYDAETWVNEGYLYLHGLLGSEVIDQIDRERLD